MTLHFDFDTPRRIFYAGEVVTLYLESDTPFPPGKAMLRTNLGMAAVRRQEVIAKTERKVRPAGRDWRDLAMKTVSERRRELRVALAETGIFAAKPYFAPADGGRILWPAGGNLTFKVEAAVNIGANIMYTAFVRQFGPNLDRAAAPRDEETALDRLDRAGYHVLPPSGTFRALKGKLDFIFGELGARILQLLPIHPAPTVYGRMGRYGSPFAALDYFAVDPALAEFDPKATPMEQFEELVDAVHARKGRIFLDIPVNHTGWASRLASEHPDWFVRSADGTFQSPGAWGVVWADLCKLDYSRPEVFRYMAEVFLFWCRKGVDGFRCDAGYMLPANAWEYIAAKVRNEYPDTVFMLEGLGGPPEKQEELLGRVGLDWGYSELFQNYHRREIEQYERYADRCGRTVGTLINFAETHDNNRLAATSPVYAAMRCALMVFLADGGAFGFTNGVEWLADEKIDVHGASGLRWGGSPNLVKVLQKLHAVMRNHPAFYGGAVKRLENLAPDNALSIRRTAPDGESVLALVNLDWEHPQTVCFTPEQWPDGAEENFDLLRGEPYALAREGGTFRALLGPGEYRLLSTSRVWIDKIAADLAEPFHTPEAIRRQKVQLAAIHAFLAAAADRPEKIGKAVEIFRGDFRRLFQVGASWPLLAEYRIPADCRRAVMIPPGGSLAILAPHAFRAELKDGETTVRFGQSVRLRDGQCLVLFEPLHDVEMTRRDLALDLTVFEPEGTVRRRGMVRALTTTDAPEPVVMRFGSSELEDGPPRQALGANDRGGYSQLPAAWGTLNTKYDAVLAANLNPDFPVDRRVMLSRFRAWVVLNDFSQELNINIQESFRVGTRNLARWEFAVPVGQGRLIRLDITCRTALDANAVEVEFRRRPAGGDARMLPDATPVKLIVRPDLDDRVNHELTKAYRGPERNFPRAVSVPPEPGTLVFAPGADRKLTLRMPGAEFHREDEWHYMVEFPLERYYGLEFQSDLYSPGYWSGRLSGHQALTLRAGVNGEERNARFPGPDRFPPRLDMMQAAKQALALFVVKRNEFHTVIAGYPWFLDWGRDTLIALRGLIAAGHLAEARDMILQFAAFEREGTIPNMIRGDNDSNRDTSDAPLWLAVAVGDFIAAAGSDAILSEKAGKSRRTVFAVLASIAEHYCKGTPNGIRVDPESNLVFSPAHFTWMDTNYPAAAPREGYPVEIQALWYRLQTLLGGFDPVWKERAEQTEKNFRKFFVLKEERRLSDCLHAAPGVAAAKAVPDNAIRPNQLFALTLGLVRDRALMRDVVHSCECLLIPGAIRSLADAPVSPPLPVVRDGQLLNDPEHPYCGHYRGPEDTMRKVAYHNGTAWCWPFPSFAEALLLTYGEAARPAARALLATSADFFNGGCPGQIAEVADGDWPHQWGGCAAQAWSVSEFYRVGKLLWPEKAD